MTAEEIRTYLASRYDFHRTLPLEEVVTDVEKMLRTWQVQVTHPRYFGLFNPSVTLASVVADTLVAMYNSQLANWRTSPAANEIERHTLGWLAEKFGLPRNSIATFTSGGTEANLSAVVVALTRAFPDYGEHGLRHLNATPSIYLTAEAHNGYNKIAHMTGLGRRALRVIPTDSNLKMNLERTATAGGGRSEQWLPSFHGYRYRRNDGCRSHRSIAGDWAILPRGGAVVSRRRRLGRQRHPRSQLKHYLAGIEVADSITCDAHKWLSVSMGCGMFFCRHPDTVAEAFRADVSYMPGKKVGPVFDPFTNSAQWSRRFIGLKLFMSLAQTGRIRLCGDDRTPDPHGRCAARRAQSFRVVAS